MPKPNKITSQSEITPKRKLTLLEYNVHPNNAKQSIIEPVTNAEKPQEKKTYAFNGEKRVQLKKIQREPDDILLGLKEFSKPSEDDENEEDDEILEPLPTKSITSFMKKPHFDPYALKHPPRQRQEEAFKVIDNGDNVCVVLPTGYGKTNVAMYDCEKCRAEGKVFVILAPLKALVTEHASDAKFGEYFNIVQISGDFTENKKKFGDPNIDGFIMTFEMFFQMFLVENYRDMICQRVGLVVFDEAHLVCDKSRGHRIEAIHYLLDYFHPHCKRAMLSATVGNGKEFAEHFHCQPVIAEASERPVKLNKSFHPQPKVYSAKDRLNMAKRNVDFIINQYIDNDVFPHILFFVTSREDVDKIAFYINDAYGSSGVRAGNHHAGMKKEDRHATEENYRKNPSYPEDKSAVNVVVCTTTLSMGLDMPTDVCVMLGMTFYEFRKSSEKLMDNNQAIQILGRAGRGNGSLSEGYTYMFFPQEQDRNVRSMVNTPLRIQSQIPNHLDYILLCYLVAGIPENDLLDVYKETFIDHIDIGLYTETLNWLKKGGFIEQDGTPTPIGTKTAQFALEPKTVLHAIELKKILDRTEDVGYPTLFGLMIMNEEFCGNISVRQNAQYDQSALRNANRFFNQVKLENICEGNDYFLDKINSYYDQMLKGFAMTFAFHLQTRFGLESISVNNNDLDLLRKSAQRMIKGFFMIIGKDWKFGKKFKLLDKCVQSSLPVFEDQMVRVMQIKGLGGKIAYTLWKTGVENLEQLSKIPDADISRIAKETKRLVGTEKDKKKYEKTFSTVSEMRLRDFKKEAKMVLRNEDNEPTEIFKTDVDLIASGLIESNPMNEKDEEIEDESDLDPVSSELDPSND